MAAAGRRRCLLALGVSALSGCALLRSQRPDPPPYPALRAGANIRPKWQVRPLGSSPVGFQPGEHDGLVWVADASGARVALDLGSGAERMRHEGPPLSAGIAATVGVRVGVGRNGDVMAWGDADKGKTLWTHTLDDDVITPPRVVGNRVVVRTVDNRIVCLDLESGSVEWTYRKPPPALMLRQSAGLLARDGVVYAGFSGGVVVAIDLRYGVARWETPITAVQGATELDRVVDIVGQPVFASDRVCVVAYQRRMACLDPDSGQVRRGRDSGSASGLGGDDERLAFFDADDVLQAWSREGALLWKQDAFLNRGCTAPVVTPQYVVFGDRDGHVHVLSADKGEPLARIAVKGAVVMPPVRVAGAVLVQSSGGSVLSLGLES